MLCALCFFLLPYTTVSFRLVFGCLLYLIGKGYLFKGDLLSMIDLVIGGLLFFMYLFSWKFLCIFLGIYLFIKGAYSIFSSFV
jgi:hypothetical protein